MKPARGKVRPTPQAVARAEAVVAASKDDPTLNVKDSLTKVQQHQSTSREQQTKGPAKSERDDEARSEQDATVRRLLEDSGCVLGQKERDDPPLNLVERMDIDSTHVTEIRCVPSFSWAGPCRKLDQAYERIRTIGKGLSGVVHLARPKDGGPLVALKRLHSKLSANSGVEDGTMTEAVREAAILSMLQHPNVVGLKVRSVV